MLIYAACSRLLAIVIIKYPKLWHPSCTADDDLDSFSQPIANSTVWYILSLETKATDYAVKRSA